LYLAGIPAGSAITRQGPFGTFLKDWAILQRIGAVANTFFSKPLERLHDDQNDDRKHQHGRDLIYQAIEALRTGVGILGKVPPAA